MQRVVAVLVLLLVLAGGLALYLSGREAERPTGDVPPPEISLQIERTIAAGDTDQAQVLFHAARDEFDEAELAYLEGLLAFDRERLPEAIQRLEHSLSLRPGDGRTFDALVACLLASGQSDAARTLTDAFLTDRPDHPRVLWLRAVLRMRDFRTADPAGALDDMLRIERHVLEPEGVSAGVDASRYLDLRARARSALGKHTEAIGDAEEAVEQARRNGKSAKDPLMTLAVVLGAASAARADPELEQRALQACADAVQIPPATPRPWVMMAEILLQDRSPDDDRLGAVLECTAHMYERWPEQPVIRSLRARALGRSNDPEHMNRARDLWEGLHRQFPDDLTVLRNYAVFLYDWKQGGQSGRYRDQAHQLLLDYRAKGGEIDETLRSTWETLEREAAGGE